MTSKRHRFSTCNRHPAAPNTGFCASCLHERLAGFHSDHSPPSPVLRRTQSRSSHRDSSEPRRHSCEVRPRSSLSDLFGLYDDSSGHNRNRKPEAESANSGSGIGETQRGGEGEVRVLNEEDNDEETKTMKEFIDLELQSRNNAGRDFRSFRNAFTEKFRKWKWKHKLKKKNHDSIGNGSIEELKTPRGLGETQSEIGECRLGRRSCDTDPRLSMETRRISVDWARASCDGCLIGKPFPCSCSRLSSIDSDANNDNGDDLVEESSNVGFDELKLMSNAKVSPTTTDLFCGAKLVVDDKDLSLKDTNVKTSDCVIGSASDGVQKKGLKKFHKWGIVWNKLGIEDKLRRVVNLRASESVSQKLVRSYSVSCRTRNSCTMAGLVNSLGAPETNGNVLNVKQESMFQRNRSVGYSPSNLDTGLLRFYLTPLKSHRRSKSGKSSING